MESLSTRLLNVIQKQQSVTLTAEEFAYILNLIQYSAKLETLEELESTNRMELLEEAKNEFNQLTKTDIYKEIYPFLEETSFFN